MRPSVSFVMQDFLRGQSRVVQLCVVHGRSLVGMNTQNVSACLMTEVRRVRGLVEELGALLSWSLHLGGCVLGRLSPDSDAWDRMADWLDTRH